MKEPDFEGQIAIKGSPGSPYTRKMLAVLRYRLSKILRCFDSGSRPRTFFNRACSVSLSTSFPSSSAAQNSRSFCRFATAFEIHKSCISRHRAFTPLVEGDS